MKSRILLVVIVVIFLATGIFFLTRRNQKSQSPVAEGTAYPMESAVRSNGTDASNSPPEGNQTPFPVADAPSALPSVSSGKPSAPFEPFLLPKQTVAPTHSIDELRKQLSSNDFWRMTIPNFTDKNLNRAYEQASKQYQEIMTYWANTYIALRMPNISHPVTDEDITALLWPKEYIEKLGKIQDLMVQEHFLSAEARKDLKNEDQIYAFYKDLLGYMQSKGLVTDEHAKGFTKGIEQLPQLINGEREALRFGIAKKNVMVPGGQRLVKTNSIKDIASDLLRGLAEVFTAPKTAHAQVPVLPGWYVFPDCYKDLVQLSAPGINLIAFCCDCGIVFRAGVPIFLPTCGPLSVLCDLDLGCLNLVCAIWPNAIWDGPGLENVTPTGICGCG